MRPESAQPAREQGGTADSVGVVVAVHDDLLRGARWPRGYAAPRHRTRPAGTGRRRSSVPSSRNREASSGSWRPRRTRTWAAVSGRSSDVEASWSDCCELCRRRQVPDPPRVRWIDIEGSRWSRGRAGAVRKPGSVPGSPRGDPGGDHFSGTTITRGLEQPTRESSEAGRLSSPIWSCTGRGLPCPSRHREGGGLLPHRFTLAGGPKPA